MDDLIMKTNIEYVIIILVLIVLFVCCLKKRGNKLSLIPFVVDKNFSVAVKGVACVMILLSHYGKRVFGFDVPIPLSISKVVWWSSANIALVWFMFFSGYGLSLKDYDKDINISKSWIQRIWKVYKPYLLVIIITSLIGLVLPEKYSFEELKTRIMSMQPYYMHHISEAMNLNYLYGLLIHSSWYVECIIWFYSIYYLSTWLSKAIHFDKTTLLCLLMLLYLIVSFFYFGQEQAHYFRYVCVFIMGHLVVRWRETKWYGQALSICVILFNLCLIGGMYIIWFILGFIALFIFSIINTRYTVSGKAILLLGSISYFFYLSHVGISWTLLCYSDVQSCLAWTGLSTIVAFLLYKLNVVLDKFNKLVFRDNQ